MCKNVDSRHVRALHACTYVAASGKPESTWNWEQEGGPGKASVSTCTVREDMPDLLLDVINCR
jgi:hypothetical protein